MVSNTKLSWDFLKQFNFNRPPKIILGRNLRVMDKYNHFKNELNQLGIKIEDYINIKYFNDFNVRFYLDKNRFPYYCCKDITHYVIWINNLNIKNSENIEESIYRDFICSKIFKGDYDKMNQNCIYFENYKDLRSIKGVRHLHVFIRNI